jgi:peroxiredoxin
METMGTVVGAYAPDFELPGVDGEVHHLARYRERFQAIAVVIMCNHCPYVRQYLDRLKQLQADFQEQGVTLVGINANDETRYPEDSFDQMKAFTAEHQLNFPYLRDVTQDVARSFGATSTPEVFLIDRQGILRYSGAVDDNVHQPDAVNHAYLREAIAQVLSGTDPAISSTTATGCSVKWRQ